MRRRWGRRRRLGGRHWEIYSERRATGGKRFRLDVSAVFANDGHADTEPQAGSATGTLCSVEGIENSLESFGADADSVVLHGDRELIATAAGTNLDAARIAHLSNGLFGIGNKVEKNLNQLVGIPDHAAKFSSQAKTHLNIVSLHTMFMQLERALE